MSLADILSLRDAGLAEQEAWAVCLECGLALRSVAASASALFHTLCITPDTLAFNSSGSICFMEQLSGEQRGWRKGDRTETGDRDVGEGNTDSAVSTGFGWKLGQVVG